MSDDRAERRPIRDEIDTRVRALLAELTGAMRGPACECCAVLRLPYALSAGFMIAVGKG